MRECEKKELKDVISMLIKINKEIAHVNNEKKRTELVEECIETLNAIRDFLLNDVQSEYVVVYEKLLESSVKLCFYAKEYSNWLKNGKEISESIHKILNEMLRIIEMEKIKKIIVFLPYKASMWDSMESIWKCAKKDPMCVCIVMPIPYCDRENGIVSNTYYEGDKFPKEIPITHYDSVSLEQLLPDVIYIHNPYDELNYVTSVDPRYYSYNLKQYTDMLVYVPYFVSHPKHAKTMFQVSALNYADCIIAQSEITEMCYRKNTLSSVYEKVVALGNPKFDSAYELFINPPVLCEQWKESIGDKVVIFYNTTLEAFLKGGARYLNKIGCFFEYVKKREDVLVIWRPHPLFESTIKAMRPELKEKYNEILDKAKEISNCIYDTLPDYRVSMHNSDIYYGDGSSLAYLYSVSGKPICIQNISVDNRKEISSEECFAIQCSVWVGDILFFVAGNSNGLYGYNVKKKEFVVQRTFVEYEKDRPLMFRNMYEYKGILYLVPFYGKNIYKYEIEDDNLICIKTIQENELAYSISVMHEDKIYMIPALGGCVDIYDVEKECLIRTEIELNEFAEYEFKKIPYMYTDAIYAESGIWITAGNTKKIIHIDVNSLIKTEYLLEVEGVAGFSGIAFWKDEFWISTNRKNRIVRWKKCDTTIALDEMVTNNGTIIFLKNKIKNIVVRDNKLFLLPANGNVILMMSEIDEIDAITLPNEYIKNEYRNRELFPEIIDVYYEEDGINFVPGRGGYLIKYGPCDKMIEGNCIIPEQKERMGMYMPGEMLEGHEDVVAWRYLEGYFCELDGLISQVKMGRENNQLQVKYTKQLANNIGGKAGDAIHKYVMEKLREEEKK